MSESFSQKVKEEAAGVPVKNDCCRYAELYGYLRFASSVTLRRQGLAIYITVSFLDAAKRIISIIKKTFEEDCELVSIKADRFNKLERYRIGITGNKTAEILSYYGIMQSDFEYNLDKNCCVEAFMRGAFIGGGSISNPSGSYHLEFVTEELEPAYELLKYLKEQDINAHVTERNTKIVVYIKESEAIYRYLVRIGTHAAALSFDNERLLKELRNNANRGANCNSANSIKISDAALKQIEAIEYLEKKGLFRTMALSLRQTAEIRCDNPELSYEELAELLPDVTKSGINHRLRKIMEIAKDNGYKGIKSN